MKLDPYLRAHAFPRLERPPELWEADTRKGPFLRVLGELIAAGLARGNELPDLVLNVNNVVVEENAADDRHRAGEYVALTVRGAGDWGPEGVWPPRAGAPAGILTPLASQLREAGVVFGYSRDLSGEGSVTVWLRRRHRLGVHAAFVEAFNRRDLEGLVDLLAAEATAEVMGSPFPVEDGRDRIATTSLPHVLDPEAALVASTASADDEPWILLRGAGGDGPIDTAVRLELDGDRISRIEYVVAPHQPERLRAIGLACGLPTVAEKAS